MTAPVALVALLGEFVNCFTAPGFQHFTHFMLAHAGMWGAPHCVTETLRATLWHHARHWSVPYVFLRRGRWSCRALSRRLLDLLLARLELSGEPILAIDDTLVKKSGRRMFGLGCYRDPTDKNPGAGRRRVWGHCWVVAALLVEHAGRWLCFPLAALLFVPEKTCPAGWRFATKIELAATLLNRLGLRRVTLVVDNLYAKGALLGREGVTMVSRLRANAALYDPPPARRPGVRGRPRKRGSKVSAAHLYRRRRSGLKKITVNIYGKTVSLTVWVGIVIPSRTLGEAPILAVIFPQRGGKFNVFFSSDTQMDPVRLLELYAVRFKIEDAFDELKTHGGMGDCRQRGARAHKRHVTLCLVAYSLLRLLSATLPGAEAIEAEPWWHPRGAPSVTRLRRAVARAMGIFIGISCSSQKATKSAKNREMKPAA